MPAIGEIGYGAKLKCGATPAATEATITLGGITNVAPPSFSRTSIDVTNTESPDATMEYIPGLNDPQDRNYDLNWVPGNGTDLQLLAMTSEKEPRLFEIEYTQVTPHRTCSFRAFLTELSYDAPIPEKMTASITLKPTTKTTWTTA
jgi:hypothetical protein